MRVTIASVVLDSETAQLEIAVNEMVVLAGRDFTEETITAFGDALRQVQSEEDDDE